MNPSNSLSNSLLFYSLLIIFVALKSHGIDNSYSDCQPFDCGKMKKISYPFRQNKPPDLCGHPGFVLDCPESDSDYPLLQVTSQKYLVLHIDPNTQILKLARADLLETTCPEKSTNTSFESTPFNYTPNDHDVSLLYDCDEADSQLPYDVNSFSCAINNVSRRAYFAPPGYGIGSLLHCKVSVLVPVADEAMVGGYSSKNELNVSKVLKGGFEVKWTDTDRIKCRDCLDSKGRCGFDATINQFRCLCNDSKAYERACVNVTQPNHKDPSGVNRKLKVIIGITAGGAGILLMVITLCYFKCIKPQNFLLNHMKKDRDIEAFIRGNGHLTAKRYRFSDVKKMTKSFKDKLGQGGFGEVYKGKLSDNRLVAVKLLNSSKGNGEDFINEVASISRTSHINIVMLLGFCLEGGKRALIYEFMSNGSLEKFLFSENTCRTNPNLEWDKLIQIATGIARGLEYLHRGCNTRILHFDIKPHNILLDEDFCPKISDFGLAKLYPNNKQSNMSLLDARGTIGYIAPEIFNRNFGAVSSKSDVYSYGMMILEMVGGRKNITVGVSRTSEIYFPDWVYKHLEVENKLKIWGDMTSEENGIARKMVLVGLWCIQIAPSDRPSMSKVIEMLEGSLEALQIPPKPTLFTPRSPEAELAIESSTTSLL